jgi:hypothetical protein
MPYLTLRKRMIFTLDYVVLSILLDHTDTYSHRTERQDAYTCS